MKVKRSGIQVKSEDFTAAASSAKLDCGRLLIFQAENLLINTPQNRNNQTGKFTLTRKSICILT
jgi:hypothetical protein